MIRKERSDEGGGAATQTRQPIGQAPGGRRGVIPPPAEINLGVLSPAIILSAGTLEIADLRVFPGE